MSSNKNSWVYIGNPQAKATKSKFPGFWVGPSYNFTTSRPTLHASVSNGTTGYEASVDTTWTMALGVPVTLLTGLFYYRANAESDSKEAWAHAHRMEEQLKEEKRRTKRAEDDAYEAHERRMKAEEAQRREAERRREAEEKIGCTAPIRQVPIGDIIKARQSNGLSDNDYHVAVCGASGTGKSTLINAIRGLENSHKDAAEVGEDETTKLRTAYQDARKTPCGGHLILHDLPGSGTLTFPDNTYYNDMYLYMFNCIMVVYKDPGQLQSLVEILRRSLVNNQTVLIIRSRCDEGLANKQKRQERLGKPPNVDAVRKLYMQESTEYLENQLRNIDGLEEYITGGCRPLIYHVSEDMLRHVAQEETLSNDELDERKLVNQLDQLAQMESGYDSMEGGVVSEETERRFIFWGAQDPRPERLVIQMAQEHPELLEFVKP